MERKLIEEFDRKQKSFKDKRKKNVKQSTKAKKSKTESDYAQPSTSYRDRAMERRDGVNKDFEIDPDDLIISNPRIGTALPDDEAHLMDEQERRRQQIEESKYLGGDIEHTHLVKGLDFALLERVKSDQRLAEKFENDAKYNKNTVLDDVGSDSEEEEFRNEAILAASAVNGSKRQLVDIEKLKKGQSTEMIPCRTAVARRVLNVLGEKWPDTSELFVSRRMTYVLLLNDDLEDGCVRTILRSKADLYSRNDSSTTSWECSPEVILEAVWARTFKNADATRL